MKIAILGAGAMGLLYGAYLSRENEVYLLCRTEDKKLEIMKNGVTVQEKDGSRETFSPKAATKEDQLPELDYVVLFVKATNSEEALQQHQRFFSKNTTVLTLQNGSGHEFMLEKFVDKSQIAIGISQEGCLLRSPHEVQHTGSGFTYVGKPYGDSETLADFEQTCIACGFQSQKSSEIQRFLWEKLIFNASSSVLSGVLQTTQGYCYKSSHAWSIIENLVREIVEVACALGISMDFDTQIQRVVTLLVENPEGVPSICVDLKQGKKTEVSTISGSVVEAGKRVSVATPTHELMVNLVKSMECREDYSIL